MQEVETKELEASRIKVQTLEANDALKEANDKLEKSLNTAEASAAESKKRESSALEDVERLKLELSKLQSRSASAEEGINHQLNARLCAAEEAIGMLEVQRHEAHHRALQAEKLSTQKTAEVAEQSARLDKAAAEATEAGKQVERAMASLEQVISLISITI